MFPLLLSHIRDHRVILYFKRLAESRDRPTLALGCTEHSAILA